MAVTAPGCDEVVRDGESGILTKGDPASLAEAAIGLLLDDERRAAMGARVRQIAEREFGIERQITRTLEVYAQARERASADGAPRSLRLRFQADWADAARSAGRRPARAHAQRVLVTYPDVRHIVPDRISLEAQHGSQDDRDRRPLSRAPAVAGQGGGRGVTRREGFERLEKEIPGEKAAALGRAGEQLDAALAVATGAGQALDREIDPARRAAALPSTKTPAAARDARTMLLIQREAIGLRHHRIVDQQFPNRPAAVSPA